MNTDHVFLQRNECVCEHCGQRYLISVPCPLNVFEAIIKAFLEGHKKCKKVEA